MGDDSFDPDLVGWYPVQSAGRKRYLEIWFFAGVLSQTQAQYVRRRITRRLYCTTDDTLITAGVNLAYIITLTQSTQKHPPNHFRDRGCVLRSP
jgi:hypothetical protein